MNVTGCKQSSVTLFSSFAREEQICFRASVSCDVRALFQGNCLDSLARKFLWDVGLDYMHGTGHGIGMYLNVHEGPMGVSWKVYPNDPGLQEGMFISDGKKLGVWFDFGFSDVMKRQEYGILKRGLSSS